MDGVASYARSYSHRYRSQIWRQLQVTILRIYKGCIFFGKVIQNHPPPLIWFVLGFCSRFFGRCLNIWVEINNNYASGCPILNVFPLGICNYLPFNLFSSLIFCYRYFFNFRFIASTSMDRTLKIYGPA